MSCDPHAIEIRDISKVFPVYAQPYHRLAQMLDRRNKQRWYREFIALHAVSFNVERGETLGIVGRNGSGKSTLLQIICGTQTPTAGQVNVNGRVAALLELGSGFNPEFSGRENVFLNGMVLGLSREEIEQRFDAIAAFAEIGEFMERPVRTYSSGMYVRLAFAVAINVTPDILIVDEALSVGDEAFQRKCFARIDRIRDEGATILFVSHSASTVVELCNRAVLLDSGEMLAMGSPKYIVSRYQKLLYSPSDKIAAIRAEIKSGKETDVALEAGDSSPSDQPTEGDSSPVPQPRSGNEADLGEAYFEEGMVPKSTFHYNAVAAAIEDPHIETLVGTRVNVLKTLREYVYVYRVRFDQGAAGVRFGMLIKNVKGLDLAGCATSREMERLSWVDAGTVLEVRFRFPCMFSSDTYFMNAGVQGRLGEEDIYLDRVIDAVMFKVIHEPGRLATTMVDLDIIPTVEVKEPVELQS